MKVVKRQKPKIEYQKQMYVVYIHVVTKHDTKKQVRIQKEKY